MNAEKFRLISHLRSSLSRSVPHMDDHGILACKFCHQQCGTIWRSMYGCCPRRQKQPNYSFIFLRRYTNCHLSSADGSISTSEHLVCMQFSPAMDQYQHQEIWQWFMLSLQQLWSFHTSGPFQTVLWACAHPQFWNSCPLWSPDHDLVTWENSAGAEHSAMFFKAHHREGLYSFHDHAQ